MKMWNENKEFREEYEQRKLMARNQQYPTDGNATNSNRSE